MSGKAWTVPTIYVASYWHRDCDPLGDVVGMDRATVERLTQEQMDAEYRSICEECDCDDCESSECLNCAECDCDCCEDTLRWAGQAHGWSLTEYARDLNRWQRQDLYAGLRGEGYAYL